MTSIPAGRSSPAREGRRPREMRLIALAGLPMVRAGDDVAQLILDAVRISGEGLETGDVLVIAQKVFSKAEGRAVALDTVTASARAHSIAAEVGKDPRLIELVLSESTEVLRFRRDVIVVAHRLGFVMANAGIDFSNVEQDEGAGIALLLPTDPDRSCAQLRERLFLATGADVAVVMNDSHGRAWRNGTVGVAIGTSGLPALLDLRGSPDLFERPLRITQVGLADEVAAAASLLMGQADEATPAVLMRGVPYPRRDSRATELVRAREHDLFR